MGRKSLKNKTQTAVLFKIYKYLVQLVLFMSLLMYFYITFHPSMITLGILKGR